MSLSVQDSFGTYTFGTFFSVQSVLVHWISISVQSLSVHTKYRHSQLWHINVNFSTSVFGTKVLTNRSQAARCDLNSAFRGWFRCSSNSHNVHCDEAGAQRPFKRSQLRKPGRLRWRVCWRWFALWSADGDQCLIPWTRTFNCTQITGNRTLRTQDTSVPRHFGTSAEVSPGAEVSGQFGTKTLRHEDISALVSGHFGTSSWTLRHYSRTPLRQCAGLQ